MGDLSNEPSMEEILASIKKIIAEDADRKIAPPLRRPAPRMSPSEPVEPTSALPAETIDSADDEILELGAPMEEPVATMPDVPEPAESELVSAEAALASRAALASLSGIAQPSPAVAAAGETSLEGLVRDMLQPMLKDWLDAHLPEIVERIVAREVARISGRSL